MVRQVSIHHASVLTSDTPDLQKLSSTLLNFITTNVSASDSGDVWERL